MESLYQQTIFLQFKLKLGLYAVLYITWLSNHNMGMTDFYISTYIDWVNHNACFTYLLMGTFRYIWTMYSEILLWGQKLLGRIQGGGLERKAGREGWKYKGKAGRMKEWLEG